MCSQSADLITFRLFGEEGFVLVQLFNMFISAAYYIIGYPMAYNISKDIKPVLQISVRFFGKTRLCFSPQIAMIIGLVLNFSDLKRPLFMNTVVAVNIPLVSILLGVAIGLTLRIANNTRLFERNRTGHDN